MMIQLNRSLHIEKTGKLRFSGLNVERHMVQDRMESLTRKEKSEGKTKDMYERG
jgi:hypothetical protein